MNFLAHQALSGENASLKAGNFLGDFVKGKQYEIFPPALQKGVQLHRFIDYYTDNHHLMKDLKKTMYPYFSKYTAVVLDILFDHCLAQNWDYYYDVSLNEFAAKTYLEIESQIIYFPPNVVKIFMNMKQNNWLENYATPLGLEMSLKNIAQRTHFDHKIPEAEAYFQKNKTLIMDYFNRFFSHIQNATQEFIQLQN